MPEISYNENDFLLACERDDADQVYKYIKDGVNVSVKLDNGETALHCAAKSANSKIACMIIDGSYLNPMDGNKKGETFFHIAACNENPLVLADVYRYCHEMDVNVVDNEGNTPLHFCRLYGTCPEMVAVLLALGADPNIKNKDGKTFMDFIPIKDNGIFMHSVLKLACVPIEYRVYGTILNDYKRVE